MQRGWWRFMLLAVSSVWVLSVAQAASNDDLTNISTRPAVTLDESRLQSVDYEIALLRAEISLRQGNRDAFLQAYLRLQALPSLAEFELRWQWLTEQAQRLNWLNQKSSTSPSQAGRAGQAGFAKAATADHITLAAPLSGDLSPAGLALQQVFLQHYTHKYLTFIDTSLLSTAHLISTIEANRPDLLVLLERRERTIQLAEHFYELPTILFHPGNLLDPAFQRVLHPTYQQQALALEPWLDRHDARQITWLQWHNASSLLLRRVNHQLDRDLAPLLVESNSQLNDLVAQRFGQQESLARQNWLARIIEQPLTGIGRSRQDQAVVVFYGPIEQAMLLRPLLEYHQQDIPILWLPSELPDPNFFNLSLARWQDTLALFPSHFLADLSQNTGLASEDGLFFALGEVMVELIRRSANPLPDQFDTVYGQVMVSERGEFRLEQQWYRLQRGLEPLAPSSQLDD